MEQGIIHAALSNMRAQEYVPCQAHITLHHDSRKSNIFGWCLVAWMNKWGKGVIVPLYDSEKEREREREAAATALSMSLLVTAAASFLVITGGVCSIPDKRMCH